MFQAPYENNTISSPTEDSQQNFYSTIFSQVSSRKPRNMGLQLEFVENENLTEINILSAEFNSSFPSLITVDILNILLENSKLTISFL